MTRERDLNRDLNRDLTPQSDLSVEVLDDNDLLRLTRQGHDEAFGVLYARYVYPARRLARHLGQREESDDIVADAFSRSSPWRRAWPSRQYRRLRSTPRLSSLSMLPGPRRRARGRVDRDSIDVKLGPVEVSTGDVADTVEKLLKLPKDLLSGLTPTPAP